MSHQEWFSMDARKRISRKIPIKKMNDSNSWLVEIVVISSNEFVELVDESSKTNATCYGGDYFTLRVKEWGKKMIATSISKPPQSMWAMKSFLRLFEGSLSGWEMLELRGERPRRKWESIQVDWLLLGQGTKKFDMIKNVRFTIFQTCSV